jgi:hypothetical protein
MKGQGRGGKFVVMEEKEGVDGRETGQKSYIWVTKDGNGKSGKIQTGKGKKEAPAVTGTSYCI